MTYSVDQIAKMLNTDEETVRRWIRNGDLKTTKEDEKNPRKKGHAVTEDALNQFAKSKSKYSKYMRAIAYGLTFYTGGIPALFGLSLFNVATRKTMEQQIRAGAYAAVKEQIKNKITELEEVLSQKQSLIDQTQKEVEAIQEKLNKLQYVLDHDKILPDLAKIPSDAKSDDESEDLSSDNK